MYPPAYLTDDGEPVSLDDNGNVIRATQPNQSEFETVDLGNNQYISKRRNETVEQARSRIGARPDTSIFDVAKIFDPMRDRQVDAIAQSEYIPEWIKPTAAMLQSLTLEPARFAAESLASPENVASLGFLNRLLGPRSFEPAPATPRNVTPTARPGQARLNEVNPIDDLRLQNIPEGPVDPADDVINIQDLQLGPELPKEPKPTPIVDTPGNRLRLAKIIISEFDGPDRLVGMTDQQILDYAEAISPSEFYNLQKPKGPNLKLVEPSLDLAQPPTSIAPRFIGSRANKQLGSGEEIQPVEAQQTITKSLTQEKPKVKSITDIKGNTRVWINDVEFTDRFGPGGPTEMELRRLQSQIDDPASFRRLAELKGEQYVDLAAPQPKSKVRALDDNGEIIDTETGEVFDVPQQMKITKKEWADKFKESPIGPGKDNLFYKSKGEGLGKKTTFQQQWDRSIKEAEILGIDYTKYENLDELQWDITRETARQTIETGRNPLNDAISGGKLDTPQEMKVPGSTNIAVGPKMEDTRLLEVLGSKLYSEDPIMISTKELLQNAFDEHNISGSTQPIRIKLVENDIIPDTNLPGKSITVRDAGRGMTPDQLYTIFSDVGKTGKAGVQGAAGGFGFAKAAPLLGGKYVNVVSIVDTPNGHMLYSFEGNPKELINQESGVPLIKERMVDQSVPTGLKVTTYFDKDARSYTASRFIKNSAENSLGFNSPVEFVNTMRPGNESWLDYDSKAIDVSTKFKPVISEQPKAILNIPGADIELRYNILDPKAEQSAYNLNILNKGLYQAQEYGAYGMQPLPNLPENISANIIAKVEEEHPDYPFSANREKISSVVQDKIKEWVKENLVKGQLSSLRTRIQRSYDEMAPLMKIGGLDTYMYDQGARFSPSELSIFQRATPMKKIMSRLTTANLQIMQVADTLKWDYNPTDKLQKFGILFAAPEKPGDGATLGIHIPNPSSGGTQSAILINLFEIIQRALTKPNPIDYLGADLFTTLTHEMAHVPGGGHDTGFAYRDADLRSAMGASQSMLMMQNLASAFGDIKNGQIDRQILDLLQLYSDSRQRPASVDDPLLATGTSIKGQPDSSQGKEVNAGGSGGGRKPPNARIKKYEPEEPGKVGPLVDKKRGVLFESWNLPRSLKAAIDLSMPFRQGFGLHHKREFWTAFGNMFSALGEKGFHKIQNEIASRPMFRRMKSPDGKVIPSFAERMGLKLTDLTDVTKREENMMSTWAEKVPLVRRSNQAAVAFLNRLRADVFERLIKENNALLNEPLARGLADFVNIATGRGHLGRFEKVAVELNQVLFSPRLIKARLSYFNPNRYISTPKPVRMEMLKSLLAMTGTAMTLVGLAKLAGADVETDPSSTDFMKIKIGKTRIDVGAGFQQYLVAGYRLITGDFKSSASGKKSDLNNPKFAGMTRRSLLENFVTSKAHPTLGFALSLLEGKDFKGTPINVPAQVVDMFIPMIIGDTYELAQQDPKLLPLAVPAGFGFGVQSYDAESPGETLVNAGQNLMKQKAPQDSRYE